MELKHIKENILTIELVKEEIKNLYNALNVLSMCNETIDELRNKLKDFIIKND